MNVVGGSSKYGSQHQTRHVECRCHNNEDPSQRSIQLTLLLYDEEDFGGLRLYFVHKKHTFMSMDTMIIYNILLHVYILTL